MRGSAKRSGVSMLCGLAGAVFVVASACSLAVGATDIWTGATDGDWDSSTQNWSVDGVLGTYTDGDTVSFGDLNPLTSTAVVNTTVTIQPEFVYPASVTFTNTGAANGGVDYTINGNLIGGDTGISLVGTGGVGGGVILQTSNYYYGATMVAAGHLQLQDPYALGNSSGVTVAAGAALELGPPGLTPYTFGDFADGSSNTVGLILNGSGLAGDANGALESIVGDNTYDGPITIGSGGATIVSSSTLVGSGLTLTGGVSVPTGATVKFSGIGNTLVGANPVTGGGGLTFAEALYNPATGVYSHNIGAKLTLAAANSYAGPTAVVNGVLLLTGTIATSSSSAPLALTSGTLSFSPSSGMPTTQSLNGVSINPGQSSLTAAAGATLNVGAIAPSAGGVLDVNSGGAAGSVVTSSLNNHTGILGGWATYNGTDWAVANGGGAITPLANYAMLPSSVTTSINAPAGNFTGSGTVAAGVDVTVNSLDGSLSLGAGSTLSVSNGTGGTGAPGGILVGPGGGSIDGGVLAAGSNDATNPSSELVVDLAGGGPLTSDSAIVSGSTYSLTKSGPGSFSTNGYNTYAGPTTVSDGSLTATLGSGGPLIVNFPGNAGVSGYVGGLSGNGGAGGGALALAIPSGGTEVFSGTAGGSFRLVGSGTQVVTGAGSNGAGWELDAGTLELGLGAALPQNPRSGSMLVTLGGGTLTQAAIGQTQQLSQTDLLTGDASIVAPAGDTFDLGAFTFVGSPAQRPVVDINTGGAAGTALTSNANNSAGILGGWATFAGTDWAAVNGSGQIVAYTGYTSGAPNGNNPTTNNSLAGSGTVTGSSGSAAANSLKITGSGTLVIPYGVSLATGDGATPGASGGILYVGGPGDSYTFSAGTGSGGTPAQLTAGGADGGGQLVVNVYSSGSGTAPALTISAPINTAGGLVKAGGGSLVLTGANAYSGGTYLDSGTLTAGTMATAGSPTTPGNLGLGQITFAGGTLVFASGSGGFDITAATHNDGTNPNPVEIDGAGGTIDTNGNSVTFSNPIGGAAGASPGAFTKAGAGTLLLTGAQTYTGGTNVNGGTLRISGGGSLSAGPVNVASGAAFGGAGGTASVGGQVTIAAGGTLSPGAPGAAGTFGIAEYLAISNGANLEINVGASDLIQLGPGGAATIGTGITLYDTSTTVPASGAYPVISYGTLVDNSNGFTGWTAIGSAVAASGYAFFNNVATGSVDIVIGPALGWTGQASGVANGSWDNTTTNWANGSSAAAYFDGATVIFGDVTSPGTATVTIQSSGVYPREVNFTNTETSYTFSGGPIAGAAIVGLSGDASATVTFTSPNSYTGGTTVYSGTLITTASGTLGPGPLKIDAASGASSTVDLGSNQTIAGLSGTVASGGAAVLRIAAGTTLTVVQSIAATFGGVLGIEAGSPTSFGALATQGLATLEIDAAPTLLDYAALNVNVGTLRFNLSTGSPVIGAGVVANVSPIGTLQLAGTVSAFADPTSGNLVNVANNASAINGASFYVTGTNQSVGTVFGNQLAVPGGATVYAGDTVVGDGTDPADLTATQILQNTLTINAGATVTIRPSGSGISEAEGGDSDGDRDRADSGGNPAATELLAAIDESLDSGSISEGTDIRLDRQASSVGFIAANEPDAGVALFEGGILAELPTADWPASDDLAEAEADATLLDEGIVPSGVPSDAVAAGALAPSPVPEPPSALLALWAVVAGAALLLYRLRT